MKIRFKYTLNGETKFFDIIPRETGVTVNLSDLANVGGAGRGYFKYTEYETEYISKTPAYDNYELKSYFPADIRNAINWNADNAFVLRVANMYYDHSIPETDRTPANGQIMRYETGGGKVAFSAFVKTVYIEGEPVPYANIGGLFSVYPTASELESYAGNANYQEEYSTEDLPKVLFDLITVHDGTKDYPCLLVTVGRETMPNPEMYIFDIRMFSGSEAQPVIDTNTTTPYGRTGTYNFTSDQMIDVPPTGYSFVNRWPHGLTLYHINDLQAEAIFAEFWGNETLWQMFLNSTIKQIQGVLCMHKVPVPVASGSSTRALSIFGKRVARGELLEQLPLVNSQIVQYPETPQWVSIEEIYGDYFDYAGQTRFSVYLPFVGTVPIDVNKIMGGAIKTVYHVDLLTGNLIARVYGRNSMGNGAQVLLFQGSGNCALHIPYIGNDQGGMKLLGALAGVATAGLATVATGGAASAPALAAISGTAGYALAPHNASVNNIPTEAAPLSYPYVCYIMEYPERLLTELQGTQTGFATASGGANTTVSNYSGFTQGFLHADIAGATEAEKAEIENAFRNGVIL